MNKPRRLSPTCIIIAVPNGAGKTTFAREFLAKEADVVHFVNPDLIASGLSPLRPELRRSRQVAYSSENLIGLPMLGMILRSRAR